MITPVLQKRAGYENDFNCYTQYHRVAVDCANKPFDLSGPTMRNCNY